jgi:NAD-dependent dihydropyrimidine dehydrogenase PreA subunit
VAHATSRTAYTSLAERLNRFPQGAPDGELLTRILKMLFSEREAELVALLPIRPFTASEAARRFATTPAKAKETLDALASRSLLLDVPKDGGETRYVLPPPMAGFFEFTLMRVRSDVDQKALSELFFQYLNVEEDFVRALFTEGQTQLGRVFVNEESLPADDAVHVLDYERASAAIRDASDVGVGTCYCRHKMEHLGKACGAPMEICMTLGRTASSLIRHGTAQRVPKEKALDLLALARDKGLVQFGENVRSEPSFICNCCGCCCEALLAQRRFGLLRPVHTTNFRPVVDEATCNGCGLCASACPVDAMAVVSAHDPKAPKRRTAKRLDDACLGCGVCVPACHRDALKLEPREARVFTPVDTVHRTVLMAIERGKLQELIFDNRAEASHRAMAAILGAILRLPPVKRALASRQMGSRYVEALLARHAAKERTRSTAATH